MEWDYSHSIFIEVKKMAFWEVDGKVIKTPSQFDIEFEDISASDAGRTQDALMHKNRVARKCTIKLAWNNPTPEEVQHIYTAFSPEYFQVKFPFGTGTRTLTFYAGNQSYPMKQWFVGGKRYGQVAFNIIER